MKKQVNTVNKLFTIFTPKPKRVIFDFGTDLLEFKAGQIGFNTWYEDPNLIKSMRLFPFQRARILKGSADAYDSGAVLNKKSLSSTLLKVSLTLRISLLK